MHQYAGVLRINLAALRRNWQFMRDRFSGAHCGAVVKANAYGLGVAPVVQALYSEGCRRFFVATFDEGVQVRRLVPEDSRIFVLQGCSPGMERHCVTEGLVPVMVSLDMLDRWCRATEPGARDCALKVNTGMNRLGVSPDALLRLCEQGDFLAQAGVRCLISHLACADEPDHSMNRLQLRIFQDLVQRTRVAVPDLEASLANSAGILLGPDWHFDLARPGIALYGGGRLPGWGERLETVASLHLPVLQVRTLNAGDAVGYGAVFRADRPTPVAVVAGGYADGVFRSLSNRLEGWFHQRLRVLGRISMDSCVFDLSGLPEALWPREGDEIEILGDHCDLDALAAQAGTIAYEILTGMGSRLQRVYRDDG